MCHADPVSCVTLTQLVVFLGVFLLLTRCLWPGHVCRGGPGRHAKASLPIPTLPALPKLSPPLPLPLAVQESKRVAELLSQLPADMDVERMVAMTYKVVLNAHVGKSECGVGWKE